MGLDPGIDHMSAMQIITQNPGCRAEIYMSFRSHTGGLVAPESDDNPWHYKISWNPANVVKAGSSGAVFIEEADIKKMTYQNLFEQTGMVEIKHLGQLCLVSQPGFPGLYSGLRIGICPEFYPHHTPASGLLQGLEKPGESGIN